MRNGRVEHTGSGNFWGVMWVGVSVHGDCEHNPGRLARTVCEFGCGIVVCGVWHGRAGFQDGGK
jgi:hypothetical protein